jgi:hypothetical protein
MNRYALFLFAAVFSLLALPVSAGGKKNDKAAISFHLEADANDNPKMVGPAFAGGRERPFRRVPEIGMREIAAFAPFRANDGVSQGIMLQLKPTGARRLSAITNTNPGRYLLASVNGRNVDSTMIDGQVNDGVLVIWSGVSALEIEQLDKVLPRIGAEKKKK